ncbi:hypothetical protein [Kushneria indalinina]|uniref:Uncharacterized protein n=1 Tax=Kushneria indalinina DSM 14324 TaxID=1122140 RepID=A0A3D9E2L5_9GAMM|nr:hypothetical protein [Kushneria indalinina]REC96674.1 hypothetical protein C8D72_0006 [Kushneria indalinina DSM 14324]
MSENVLIGVVFGLFFYIAFCLYWFGAEDGIFPILIGVFAAIGIAYWLHGYIRVESERLEETYQESGGCVKARFDAYFEENSKAMTYADMDEIHSFCEQRAATANKGIDNDE